MEKSQEEIAKEKELRKKEEKQEKEKRKKEYEEAAKRRGRQSYAASEVSIKIGAKTVWYQDLEVLSCIFLFFIAVNIGLFIYSRTLPSLAKIPVIDVKNITEHNLNSTWKQAPNTFFEGKSMLDAKKLMGIRLASDAHLNKCFFEGLQVPEKFDSREKWPECKLPPPEETHGCAGSYGSIIASTLAEKMCLADPDNELINLSSQELISCDQKNEGCEGGSMNVALNYLERYGIANESCFPSKDIYNMKCQFKCKNATKYRTDSYCVMFGAEDMKKEINSHGPVISVMEIYTDFLTYKSGIYRIGKDAKKFTKTHAIKIIGWGEEEENGEKVKYWLIENSWGKDWGDNGVAKVAQGQDFFFEKYAYSILLKKESDSMQQNYFKHKYQTNQTEGQNETESIKDDKK